MERKPVDQRMARTYNKAGVQVRGTARLSVECKVRYSGVSSGTLFISDGTMIDLSDAGWGIRGTQPVQPGMVLTLWVHHPDDEDSVIVDEVTVAWVSGQRFGLQSFRVGTNEGPHSVSIF